ncbi:MAG TPA: hypothetical protein VM100_11910, partial [Longimicrobiales bacterium]|nr:hypothetical protein [Longimicrobiales bacterium]
EDPTDNRLTNNGMVGVWAGTEEITTDEDIASNLNFPGTNGFLFPVMIMLEGSGRFTLTTSNYPTSYNDLTRRTCTGLYTHANSTIQFYPAEACRVLPLSKYTIGRQLSGGLSFEARTNTSTLAYTYTSVHVLFHLTKQ